MSKNKIRFLTKYPCIFYTNANYSLPSAEIIQQKYRNKFEDEYFQICYFDNLCENCTDIQEIHTILKGSKITLLVYGIESLYYYWQEVKPYIHSDEKEEITDLYINILLNYDGNNIPIIKIEKLRRLTRFSISKKRKTEDIFNTNFKQKIIYNSNLPDNCNLPKLYIDGYNKVMKNKNIKLTEENFVSLCNKMNFISKIPYIRNYYRGKLNAYLALSGVDYLIERNNKIWGVTQQCSVIEIPLNDIKLAQVN